MFGNMADMMGLMGKMKDLQSRMKEAQEQLTFITETAESGGGMVKATVDGKRKLLSLDIDKEIINADDKEMLQDLIVAAVNKANENIESKIQQHLQKATDGVLPNIPGLDLGGFYEITEYPMTPSVAIVILNYNGQHYLEKFLPKVIEHSGNHAIWVADNASTDQSLDWLNTRYPDLNTLVISENKGYAGGYNDALRRIQADYYILLNSDIEVTENWIAPVIAFMESDPLIAACQPKIRAYDLPTHFEYAGAAGGYMDYLGYPFLSRTHFDTREEDLGQYDDEKDVFWATGACLFVRSSAFHAASGFDESFFAHMEEIDLCWRLLNMRFRITYCGKSTVYHVGGGTLHKSNPKKTFLNYRNNLIMLFKNLPKGRRWKTVLIRLVLDGISSVRFMATGAWPDVLAIVRAHFAFYAMIPELTRKTQRTRYRAPLYYRSVVWEYFVLGKHKFGKLTGIEPIKAPRL